MPTNSNTFRTTLRRAIGARTQAQFANDAGLSAEHLSRLLNAPNMHKPTHTTLQKIANVASNGVMLQDLEQALETYDDKPEESFEKRANMAMDSFVQIVREAMLPTVAKDVPSAIRNILAEVENRAPSAPPVSYLVHPDRPYPEGLPHSYAKRYAVVELTMADDSETASTTIVVYFDYVPNADGKDICLLHRIGCKPCDIGHIYGFPEKIRDEIDAEDDPKKIERLMNLAYYLDIEPVNKFQEPRVKEDPKSAKQRLIDAIFGYNVSYPQTIIGLGFWLDGVPSNFKSFVKDNLKVILSEPGTEPNQEDNYETELKDLLASPDATSEDVAGVMDKYQSMYGLTWGGVITNVIFEATGFDFQYIRHSEGEYMTGKDCVVIDMERENVSREAVLMVLARYATWLGIESFGDIIMTYMEHGCTRPRRYKANIPNDGDECPIKLALDKACYDADPEREHPGDNGIYNCRLKDGRRYQLLYVKELKKWYSDYVDWTPWIERYDPSPVETYPSEKRDDMDTEPVEQAELAD